MAVIDSRRRARFIRRMQKLNRKVKELDQNIQVIATQTQINRNKLIDHEARINVIEGILDI